MLKHLRPGHLIQVTILEEKTYVGKITFISDSLERMELENAVHWSSDTTIGVLKCYRSEISSIKLLKPHDIANEKVKTSDFSLPEILEFGGMLNNYVLIERFDVKYHNAIADMWKQSYIGLYVAGAEKGRFSTASIISISTATNIYLLDIMTLGKIETGLKKLLEANVPKKVVHNSDKLADNLKTLNVNLNGVFDTMVAHVTLGYGLGRISLRECLDDHLNIPDEFLLESTEQWQRRPLSFIQKSIAAGHVIFLRKFYFKLIQEMLRDIYPAFDRNVNLYRKE